MPLGPQGRQALAAQLALWERLGPPVPPVPQELQVPQELLAQQALMDCRVQLVRLECRVLQDRLDLRAQPELMERVLQ